LRIVLLSTAFAYIAAQAIPFLALNDGLKVPIVGFGAMGATEQAIRDAIADGYRHIDTSLNYNDSELLIAKVLKDVFKEGKIKREDLWITTKLEGNYHQRANVTVGIKESLKRLGLDYVDLYLVHQPTSTPANISIVETWAGMMDVLKANLTRSIGVSNFNEAQIDQLLAINATVKPVTNQVRSNPHVTQVKLLDYLNKHDITMTAWSPMGGNGDKTLLTETKLIDIGKKYNVSAAQVALKYQVQRNVIVIPKANTPAYIKENMDLFSFTLTADDIKTIESLNK